MPYMMPPQVQPPGAPQRSEPPASFWRELLKRPDLLQMILSAQAQGYMPPKPLYGPPPGKPTVGTLS